jgi:hypothetical protein
VIATVSDPAQPTGTWEACFASVAPGSYLLTSFFNKPSIPQLVQTVTVVPYALGGLSIDQVSVSRQVGGPTGLTVGGALPAGFAAAAGARGLNGRATYGGTQIKGWEFLLRLSSQARWEGSFTVPAKRKEPYVIHASIEVNNVTVHVAREFRYVVGAAAPG